MKKYFSTTAVLSTLLILTSVGCHHKPADTKTQLDQATQAMAQAESPQPAAAAAPAATATPAPSQQMNEALASYKSGNLEDAVTRFQKMRAQTPMTGEELMALNNAMGAVMGEIYARAAKGDVRAQQAVQEYQRLQQSRQR